MKRMTVVIIVLLMLLTVAAADSVVQMKYTLITPDFTREGLYTGQVVNNEPQGFGVFQTQNGSGLPWHYIGYWVNGLMQGQGGTYWDDGAAEIGLYDHGYMIDGYAVDVAAASTPSPTPQPSETVQYIGNRKSKKFHLPGCEGARKMKQANKIQLYSYDEAVALGYSPCEICNPSAQK